MNTELNAKQVAAVNVAKAVEGLTNGDILEVLAAVGVAHVAEGADNNTTSEISRARFIMMGVERFKSHAEEQGIKAMGDIAALIATI